jgi:uncharacterized protein (DUF433 family)
MTISRAPKPHPTGTVPGVDYSPADQRARIAGTGLEVREIIEVYRLSPSFEGLQKNFDWLTKGQLRAALDFAEANLEFIAAEMAEADAVPQRLAELWEKHPQTKPPHLR